MGDINEYDRDEDCIIFRDDSVVVYCECGRKEGGWKYVAVCKVMEVIGLLK